MTANYVASLDLEAFKPIEKFLQTEGLRFNLEQTDPVIMDLAPEIKTLPPAPPFRANMFAIMWWSLQMRYWAWKHDTYSGPLTNIQVFVLYHDPETHVRLDHSFGLKKGHIAMVNGFATRHQAPQNNVIIVHEMLHTLGATDKYNLQTLQPDYPEGYAEPDKKPLLPQESAEIMGGVIPLSRSESKTPDSLLFTVIGPATAKEIKWLH
jgi:hypothetical protein